MERLLPTPERAPADEAGLAHWLARAYAYPPGFHVRANMVASLDGASVWRSRSGGLSGPADQALLAVLRALADVIVVGAETARRERYGPAEEHPHLLASRLAAGRPRTPALAVVSRRLDLPPPLLEQPAPPGAGTLVFTTRSAPPDARRAVERHGLEVVEAGEERVEVHRMLEVLAGRGMRAVLTEGGPRLLAQFQAAGALDELCLTLSPLVTAGDAPRILRGPALGPDPQPMRLEGLLADDSFLFTRYAPG
ncbi:dihydrofolate reductase family protein [Streptomyces sp. JJ36]|uniref:dihydrofolate reductase family protein n=1 Tax=Streptomyces sp. JJ36 TaxID=2736645 RepID=UPI001F435712|nr:dihydrofolate reductase family protein [Streptomyces sp. JJ36]MCF6521967.1 dihydrofolate reductase family protein [Streptomyces sp. JJ36]